MIQANRRLIAGRSISKAIQAANAGKKALTPWINPGGIDGEIRTHHARDVGVIAQPEKEPQSHAHPGIHANPPCRLRPVPLPAGTGLPAPRFNCKGLATSAPIYASWEGSPRHFLVYPQEPFTLSDPSYKLVPRAPVPLAPSSGGDPCPDKAFPAPGP